MLDKDTLFILMKILSERRMTTNKLWEFIQADIEILLKDNSLDLKDISLAVDFYYKTGMVNTDHNQFLVEHLLV